MDIFDRSKELMDQVQETLREAHPLIEGTTDLVKDHLTKDQMKGLGAV